MNASFAIRVWGVQGALLHGCRGISGLLSRPTRTQPIALRQTLTATHKSHLTIASASRHTQFGHIVETTTSGSVTTGAADAAGAPGECDGESTSLPPSSLLMVPCFWLLFTAPPRSIRKSVTRSIHSPSRSSGSQESDPG